MSEQITRPEVWEETETIDSSQNVGKVILFNDEWHTFEEVIAQIIKAINCDIQRAEALTWEVHTKGKACVFTGEIEECLRVSAVLEEIQLKTSVEY